ncbi:MAG: hypothetical protein AAB552_03235 [Patescibacteria group bacterium]
MNKSIIFSILVVLLLAGAGFWYFVMNDKTTSDTVIIKETPTTNAPTSADNAPPGSIHNLPVPAAVTAVKKTLARRLGVPEGEVIALQVDEKTWPDSCLGFLSKEVLCAQVLTPGYLITAQVRGETFTYRTNKDGSTIQEEY